MKSNKQRYNDTLGKSVKANGHKNGGGGGGGWGLAIILTVIAMMIIGALKMFGNGMAGIDDLTIGEGKPIPDAEEIGKHFR